MTKDVLITISGVHSMDEEESDVDVYKRQVIRRNMTRLQAII